MPDLRLGTSSGRWVVAATVLGSGMAALDATVVGIALPSIGRDFHVGIASLQWVVDAYTLALAGLLLLGGTLETAAAAGGCSRRASSGSRSPPSCAASPRTRRC
jgi:MFS family permease